MHRACVLLQQSSSLFVLRVMTALSVTALLMQGATAHPFHISVAEFEWNPQSERFEVALKLQPFDLERALSHLAGKRVRLEDEKIDAWIQKYLQANFYLTAAQDCDDPYRVSPKSSVSSVHLVGKEVGVAWMWIYFELELKSVPDKVALVNTVLTDLNESQINTVSIRTGQQKRAVRMTRDTPCHAIQPREWSR